MHIRYKNFYIKRKDMIYSLMKKLLNIFSFFSVDWLLGVRLLKKNKLILEELYVIIKLIGGNYGKG